MRKVEEKNRSTHKATATIDIECRTIDKNFHANAVIQHGPYDLQTEFQTKHRNTVRICTACKWARCVCESM